jgi:hypothetical protein
MEPTTSAESVLEVSVTLSNTVSLATTVEPSFRNAAVGSVVNRPMFTVFASIGTICAPASKTAARLSARSIMSPAHTRGTTALPDVVDMARNICPKLP